MTGLTPLSPQDLSALAARYGLALLPDPGRSAGAKGHRLRAGEERYVLRLVGDAAGGDARFLLEVHRYLAQAQFPAPRPVAPVAAGPAAGGGPAALLLAEVPGEPAAPDEVDALRCQRVGEQLGRLHDLAAGFGAERSPPIDRATVAAWLDRAAAGRDPEVAAALPSLREELARAADAPGAPRGLVHGDLAIERVLWLGDRVAAIVDWELACTDAFAVDLAVAIVAWCAGDPLRPDLARGLLGGYRSRRRLEADTAAALPAALRWASLRLAAARLAAARPGEVPAPAGASGDWRSARDRLAALRRAGDGGLRDLLGL